MFWVTGSLIATEGFSEEKVKVYHGLPKISGTRHGRL